MLNEIKVFENDAGIDERGSIWTTWKKNEWKDMDFNHDKFSISKQNVLRGLHGDTKTYLEWNSWNLSENNRKQILIPPNFANGYLCLSDKCVYHYKYSYKGEYPDVKDQFTIKWNDQRLGIKWPIENPILYGRDK